MKSRSLKRTKKKNKWGGKRVPIKIYKAHESWAKRNGYRSYVNGEWVVNGLCV